MAQRLIDERVCQAVYYKVKLLGPGILTGARATQYLNTPWHMLL